MAGARALGESGGGGVAAMDYSVHEAWNEATNIYLLAVLASLALLVYARRNKRKIMRIFTLPPTVEISEPNFYDSMKKSPSSAAIRDVFYWYSDPHDGNKERTKNNRSSEQGNMTTSSNHRNRLIVYSFWWNEVLNIC